MASIEHVMPVAIRPLDGSSEGIYRPGLQVSTYQTGYRSSRDWFEYNLRSYAWGIARFDSSTTKLKAYRAFIRDIKAGGNAGWIREALSAYDPETLISPLGDGSATSFVFPFHSSATGVNVFVDGEYQATADYTTHAAANILTDDQANAVDATTGMQAYGTCTVTRVGAPAADGTSAFRVALASSQANTGVETTTATRPACDASQEYTFFAAFRGSGNIQLDGKLYNSGGSAVGSTASDTGTMIEGGWTILTAKHAGHADAVKAHIIAYRTSDMSSRFHIGCLGVIPGDLTKWFLPSESPMVLEFDTAPTTRQRVTATGDGVRMARCRINAQRGLSWRLNSPGSASGIQYSALEELEQ